MQIEITPEYLASQGLSRTLPDRFWAKVRKTDSCWVWTAMLSTDGYGMIGTGKHSEVMFAHRASWIIHFGPIPDGKKVLHHCDNPPCIRPDHLFLGTDWDNQQDCIQKGRRVFLSRAKLNQEAVERIRQLWKDGVSRMEIANMFGVQGPAISRIIHGQRWNHNYTR